MSEFVNLNAENLDCEHLCCIIRKKAASGRGREAGMAAGAFVGGARIQKAEYVGLRVY